MKLKDYLKQSFANKEELTLKKFKSAKLIFVLTGNLFFWDYFLCKNFPNSDILFYILPIFYISFIWAFINFSYMSIKLFFWDKLKNFIYIIIFILLIIIWIILSIPFLVDNDTIKNLFNF